jgi:hypothetical protein
MGKRLVTYYDLAYQKGGLVLQLKLAMKTLVPSNKAAELPDTAENLDLFRKALEELLPSEQIPTL